MLQLCAELAVLLMLVGRRGLASRSCTHVAELEQAPRSCHRNFGRSRGANPLPPAKHSHAILFILHSTRAVHLLFSKMSLLLLLELLGDVFYLRQLSPATMASMTQSCLGQTGGISPNLWDVFYCSIITEAELQHGGEGI